MAAKSLPSLFALNHQQPNQEHTWTEWALIDFAKQKNNPSPLVFLGSSLMLMPIDLADAHFLNCKIDGATHHESVLFDSTFNRQKSHNISNFNFALPGLMPSDAYLIGQLLLSGNVHPQFIVYGLGPRDFLDNLLPSPTSTDPYRCLSQSLSKPLLSPFLGQDWQLKLADFFKQWLPLYDQKDKIYDLSKVATSFIPRPTKMITMQQLHTLLPSYNPMSIRLNECIFSPNQTTDPDRFAQNLNEYRQRYHQVNWDTFASQTKFFLEFLKLASNNNTKILVVAMPITSTNRKLLPSYVYDTYKQNLRVISKSYGAHFIDLDGSGNFSDQDFLDTVHLNAAGGDRLIKLISQYFIQHKLIEQSSNHQRIADTGIKI